MPCRPLAFVLVIILANSCALVARAAEPAGTAVDDLSRLLAESVKKHKLPGMAAAIVEGGKITAIGAAGVRCSGTSRKSDGRRSVSHRLRHQEHDGDVDRGPDRGRQAPLEQYAGRSLCETGHQRHRPGVEPRHPRRTSDASSWSAAQSGRANARQRARRNRLENNGSVSAARSCTVRRYTTQERISCIRIPATSSREPWPRSSATSRGKTSCSSGCSSRWEWIMRVLDRREFRSNRRNIRVRRPSTSRGAICRLAKP